jgi:4-hydroxybenzoate polyprenyltransferase
MPRGGFLLERLIRELRVTYGFIRRDLSVTVFPATLTCVTALHASGATEPGAALTGLISCIAYFVFHIYVFAIDNQILGVEEDRMNKPDRVLPRGLISVEDARARRLAAMVLFPTIGWLLGGVALFGWAVGWVALTLTYNHLGLHRHWLTKNGLFITLYAILLLAPAWHFGAALNTTAWRWILVLSVAMGLTLTLQDLRDVRGDEALGRRTLPIVFGETPARLVIAGTIALLPLAVHFALVPTARSVRVVAVETALALLNVAVVGRTLLARSDEADHRTYMLHTYWFCGVLASGLVFI